MLHATTEGSGERGLSFELKIGFELPKSFDFGSRILDTEAQHETIGYQTASKERIAESAEEMVGGNRLTPHVAERVIESPPLPYPIAELKSDERLDVVLEAASESASKGHREVNLSVEGDRRYPPSAAEKEQTGAHRRSERTRREELVAREVIFRR